MGYSHLLLIPLARAYVPIKVAVSSILTMMTSYISPSANFVEASEFISLQPSWFRRIGVEVESTMFPTKNIVISAFSFKLVSLSLAPDFYSHASSGKIKRELPAIQIWTRRAVKLQGYAFVTRAWARNGGQPNPEPGGRELCSSSNSLSLYNSDCQGNLRAGA